MTTLLQDLRYGTRMLLKNPGFASIAVLTLALGIGANSCLFSVVNGVLLNDLPFKEADRIVGLRETLPDEGSIPLAYRTFAEWRDRSTVFESIAGMVEWNINLESDGDPLRVAGMSVSASYFAVMGLNPIMGRTFLPEEDRPGGEQVVVLGHGFWQSRFGSDPNVINRSLRINGSNYTVVGVMPPATDDPRIGWMDVWKPLAIDDQNARANYGRYLLANARLKPGVTVEQARTELARVMNLLKQDFRETHGKDYGVDIRSLNDFLVGGNTRLALWVLLGVVGCVLLIACANVANLMLARAVSREKEIAIRTAVGASRWRLVRQLLVESVVLSIVGASVGLLLASYGIDLLIALNPDNIPRLEAVRINSSVLGFTLALTLLTGLVFGLVPALGATRIDLNEMLKEGGRGSGKASRHKRLRNLLVISEIAVALVLLTGAGLMIKSFLRLRSVDPGVSLDNVLTMEINLSRQSYPEPHRRINFYQQTLQRIAALPGVTIASATQSLPLRPTFLTEPVFVEGQPVPPRGQEPVLRGTNITSDYFRTVGIPLVKGRYFTEQETWKTSGVIIINEAFARHFFPHEDPLGKRIKAGFDTPWLTVVGVVRNAVQSRFENQIVEEMFYPYVNTTEPPVLRMNFAIRTAVDPATLVGPVRNEIRRMDRSLPVSHVLTMRQLADKTMTQPRFNLLLLNVFAAVALLLAGVGIYGVMSYATRQRTHEIGIRVALGAQRTDVLRSVVSQGMMLAAVGIGVGLIAAFALTRVMASLLFGVSATDPVTFISVAVLLTFVALIACYIPAYQATKVDPLVALRYE